MKYSEIRAERYKKGISMKEAADRLGISCSVYSQKERGKSRFSIDQIIVLAQMLDLNYAQVNDIFFDGLLPNGTDHVPKVADAS